MRIALIAEVFLPKIDGVVHRTLNLIRQLVDFGDEVLVVCPRAEGCSRCPAPVVQFPSFSFPLYPEYRIGLPNRRLVTALDSFRPEVVHYVNPFAFGFRCYDLLRRAGFPTPSTFSFHTLYGEFVKGYRVLKPLSRLVWWLMREYHNCADLNLTVSSAMQQELVKRGFERVHLWPPAVDAELFRPDARTLAMRTRLMQGHAGKKLLLTVSRLAPEKNVAFLAQVLDQVPDACLVIVGDGPQRAELESRFAGKSVNFIGYLKGAELAAAYACADAFVYASETETMGNVVLEAMACGCAVMAPRAGGIPSLLNHGETGMLYAPGSLDEAVQYTQRALTDISFRSRLGRAARQWVETWNWSQSISQVRRSYQVAIDHFERSPVRVKSTKRHRLAHALVSALVYGFKSVATKQEAARRAASRPLGQLRPKRRKAFARQKVSPRSRVAQVPMPV